MSIAEKGVLVGCDESQEWLLSWWWENYREGNSLPVAFADFGMSERAKAWCAERGVFQPFDVQGLRVALKEEIEPDVVLEWEKALSPFWGSRQAWFKKPFAMLHTPFKQTLWMDLDCEVLGPIEPIYRHITPKAKLGLVRVRDPENAGDAVLYNSGVIVFEKGSPVLKRWAEISLSDNHRFLSDQDALSQIIFEEAHAVGEVPEIYNWLMCRGVHVSAVVLHWAAQWGKEYIRKHGGLRSLLGTHCRI